MVCRIDGLRFWGWGGPICRRARFNWHFLGVIPEPGARNHATHDLNTVSALESAFPYVLSIYHDQSVYLYRLILRHICVYIRICKKLLICLIICLTIRK